MSVVLVARLVALVLSVSTFGFLFLHDSWRTDNLFLIPDLLLCVGLVVAAALPVPYLLGAFGYTAGVLTTSTFSYVADGRLGVPSLVGALASIAITVVLARAVVSPARDVATQGA